MPNYLVLVSEFFWECLEVVWSLEVNLELSIVQREVSIEVKSKARALEVTGIISGSLEQRFEVQGVKMRLSRQ